MAMLFSPLMRAAAAAPRGARTIKDAAFAATPRRC